MDWFLFSLEAICGLMLVGVYLATYIPAFRRSIMRRETLAWGMSPTSVPPVNVVRSVTTLVRGGLIGIAAGVTVSFVIANETDTWQGSGGYLFYGALVVGSALGVTLSAVLNETRRVRGLVRIARARAVSLVDYVPVAIGRLLWALVGLCIARIGLGFVFNAVYPSHFVGARQDVASYLISSVTIVTGQLITLAVFEVVSRALIRRGQFASTESELVWSDALRSHVFYTMVTAPLIVSGVGIVQSFAILSFTNTPGGIQIIANVIFGIAFLALVIFGLRAAGRRPRQQFLRRLWPDLAEERTSAASAEWTRASLELQASNAARAAEKYARRHPASKSGSSQ
jgi:hypothetical protein